MNNRPPNRSQGSPSRLWLLTLFGVILLLSVGFMILYLAINRYLGSEEFRLMAGRAVSATLQVEGEFSPFKWSGFSVYSDGFKAQGNSQSPIQELKAQGLFADFSWRSLFSGVLQIEHLQINQLGLTLQETRTTSTPLPSLPPTESPTTETATAPSHPFWMMLFPSKVAVGEIVIDNAGVSCPPQWGGVRAQEMKVTLVPDGNLWNIQGREGWITAGPTSTDSRAKTAPWPRWLIHQYRLRLRPDRLYVTQSEFRHPNKGALSMTGEIGLAQTLDARMSGQFKELVVTDFTPQDWRAQLHGELNGDFLWEQSSAEQPWQLTGHLTLDNGRVEGLPILDRIALLTQTQEFRSIKLSEASTHVAIQSGNVSLDTIRVESDGLLRIEGTLNQTDSRLEGQLQLGVIPSALRLIPGAKSEVFKESRGSYLWTPVHVTGTSQAPEEDLSGRLMSAATQSIQNSVQDTIKGAMDWLNNLRK